jgi:Zn-dependent protease with chaperone function
LGDILSTPIQLALYGWYRKSELTCDRAGLLASQNLDAVITAMMKMAGAPECHYDQLDPQQFLTQARCYQGLDEQSLDNLAKRISVMTRTHPWTVMRCAELDIWVASGAYSELIELHRERAVANAFCANCGRHAAPGATFCIHCGSAV